MNSSYWKWSSWKWNWSSSIKKDVHKWIKTWKIYVHNILKVNHFCNMYRYCHIHYFCIYTTELPFDTVKLITATHCISSNLLIASMFVYILCTYKMKNPCFRIKIHTYSKYICIIYINIYYIYLNNKYIYIYYLNIYII